MCSMSFPDNYLSQTNYRRILLQQSAAVKFIVQDTINAFRRCIACLRRPSKRGWASQGFHPVNWRAASALTRDRGMGMKG